MNQSPLIVFYCDDDLDDHVMFRDVVNEIGGIELHTFEKGQDLLSTLSGETRPQLLFLDLNMPGKNGLEVLREIRSNPDYDAICIIVFTTSNDVSMVDQTRASGADFFITKPPSFSLLRKMIQHCISNKLSGQVKSKKEFVYKV